LENQAKFNKVKTQLASISNQLTQLQASVNQLSVQLQLVDLNIQNQINGMASNEYITNIRAAMDSTTPDGLLYFPRTAYLISTGQSAIDTTTLQSQANYFYNKYLYGSGSLDMKNQIDQIYRLICPINQMNSGVLLTFTQQQILKNFATHSQIAQVGNALEVYCLLENYYIQMVNAQFQAMTILANLYNKEDPSFETFKFYVRDEFSAQIREENETFMNIAAFLLINICDFRTSTRFAYDMQYSDYGLAPDKYAGNAMARAQFLCNMLDCALDQPFCVVGGTVITCQNYTNGVDPIVNSISMTIGNKSMPNEANTSFIGCPSQFPYPYWKVINEPEVATSFPDNKYNIYRFENTDTNLTGNVPVYINNNYWERSGTKQIGGTVQVKYYNPKFPNAAPTTSPSKTNFFPFGYYTASWMWGYPWLKINKNNWQRPVGNVCSDFLTKAQYNKSGVPETFDGQQVPYYVYVQDYPKQGDGGVVMDNGTPANNAMYLTAPGCTNFGFKGGFKVDVLNQNEAVDYWYTQFYSYGGAPISGGVQIYANATMSSYGGSTNMSQFNKFNFRFKGGTGWNTDSHGSFTNKADIFQVDLPTLGTSSTSSVVIKTITHEITYPVSFSFELYNYALTGQTTVSNNFQCSYNAMVVYTGNYDTWN
jgi:hypothetical protein